MRNTKQQPQYVRPSQLAKKLHVTPQVVTNWIARGKVDTIVNELGMKLVSVASVVKTKKAA